MQHNILHLSIFLPSGGPSHLYVDDWTMVERAIETVFASARATVDLATVIEVKDGDEIPPKTGVVTDLASGRSHIVIDGIHMMTMQGEPGRYRLMVQPRQGSLERSKRRTWWGLGEFRGTVQDEYDDVWDARTVCTDVSVALELFKELFEHKGISQRIIDATTLDWDRSPGMN